MIVGKALIEPGIGSSDGHGYGRYRRIGFEFGGSFKASRENAAPLVKRGERCDADGLERENNSRTRRP